MNADPTAPSIKAMRRALDQAIRPVTVRHILARNALQPHFQPIAKLKDGAVIGYECLIRGPEGSPLRSPEALFRAAAEEGLSLELETACLRQGLRCWSGEGHQGRLFVNVSARVVVQMVEELKISGLMNFLVSIDVAPGAVVVELTEHERMVDLPRLLDVASELRAQGMRFALDDYGDGHSSLRAWAELQPEIVKIDKYFIRDVQDQARKVQTLKGLIRLAETFGAQLVAEGIETAQELQVLRDLGIEFGQGYFLGRPEPLPAATILAPAAQVIASARIAVLPELTRAAGADFTVERIAIKLPALGPEATVDEVARIFASEPARRAIAVVDEGRPLGLLNRQTFTDRYARPYFKELYGRKPCLLFANTAPLQLDRHTGLEAMTAVLTSADQRYLTDGFIVTEGGRYLGLGNGENLVRVVTEARIEAARHANPLTFLPGNIPISEHIDRLIASGGEFVACYCDLNDFKPYNDHYGYWRGDDMIRLVARMLAAYCDPRHDFVGHVGGDDFVVLFQSDDWLDRCNRIIEGFNQAARELYDEVAIEHGGIEAEDRHGVNRFFHFTTLSIGAVPVRPGSMQRAEQVATAAAAAKHKAKLSGQGLAIEVGQ